jgi:hypothetical protein
LTVKVDAALTEEAPPPGVGLVTTTGKLPPVTMSAAGIFTVMSTPVMETGVRAGFEPKVAVAPLTKFVPLMVSKKVALPAALLAGNKEVTVGTGLLLVRAKLAGAATPATVAVTV